MGFTIWWRRRFHLDLSAMADDAHAKSLIEKITGLPADRISEVEDFVDFLSERERSVALVRASAGASTAAFAAVWENPEDAVYDDL